MYSQALVETDSTEVFWAEALLKHFEMMACLLFTITMTIGESEGVRTWWREDARSRGQELGSRR